MMQGGMEGVYDDLPKAIGFMKFAPVQQARGPLFGAAQRVLRVQGGAPMLSEKGTVRRVVGSPN